MSMRKGIMKTLFRIVIVAAIAAAFVLSVGRLRADFKPGWQAKDQPQRELRRLLVKPRADLIVQKLTPAGTYTTYTYSGGSWSPSTPSIELGQGFITTKTYSEVWRQNLSLW